MFRLPYQTRHRYTGNQVPPVKAVIHRGTPKLRIVVQAVSPPAGVATRNRVAGGGMPTPRFWARDAGFVQPPSGVGGLGVRIIPGLRPGLPSGSNGDT